MSEYGPELVKLYPEIRELKLGGIVVVRALLQNPENYNEFLLLHRQVRHDKHVRNAGLWEHAGGKLSPNDNDVFAGGIREIKKASGFDIKFDTKALSRIDRYPMDGDREGHMYTGLAGVARVIGGDLVIGAQDEGKWVHDDAVWVRSDFWLEEDTIPEDIPLTKHARFTIDMFNQCTLGVNHLVSTPDVLMSQEL